MSYHKCLLSVIYGCWWHKHTVPPEDNNMEHKMWNAESPQPSLACQGSFDQIYNDICVVRQRQSLPLLAAVTPVEQTVLVPSSVP